MVDINNTEKILLETLNKIAEEQNYSEPDIKVSPVSTDGANNSSLLFEATISSPGRDDLELFAKVAAVGEKFRSQAPMRVFDIERIFYTELTQKYRELEDKHGVPDQHRLKYPKIYAVSPTLYEETVVMENLTKRGYILQDRFKSVDWEYASAAFTEIAKMHALSLALKHERPDVFESYFKEFSFQFDLFEAAGVDLKQMMEQGMEKTLAVAKDEYKRKLMKFLEKMMTEGGMEMFKKFYSPGNTPVIRHGDFRPSNIMHKVTEDGSVDTVVVDYQTLLVGNPVIDLLYFLFLGTDLQFREQHYEHLLQLYHRQLAAALNRFDLRAEDLYSEDKFHDDINENIAFGLLMSLTTLPLVLVDAADAPSLSGDQDMSSFMQMNISDLFVQRINETFEDFVQRGIL